MFHGGGWFVYLRDSDAGKKPTVTWALLRRVLGYARPYRWHIAAMLTLILITTGLGLLSPLILRDLIDHVLPNGDVQRLNLLALALFAIPLLTGGLNVIQRRLNAAVGEGVIFNLRVAIYSHLQKMSLRFFTNTRAGELMSRLNNDVVGAQSAVADTIVGIITNLVQVTALLLVLLTLEWRLTLIAILVLPLFVLLARRIGGILRDISREGMEINARMNAMMNETLNVSGALLVKLFGRADDETRRFHDRAAEVRDVGVRRAVLGAGFFALLGLIVSIGSALVVWIGGHLVFSGAFTVGTIVAFTGYLGQLYGALQGLINAPVAFATSMVSFERVFEVLDLPLEIAEKPEAIALDNPRGELTFEDVTFRYSSDGGGLLSEVDRPGRMDNVRAVLSGADAKPPARPPARPPVLILNGDDAAPSPAPASQAREMALENLRFTVQPGQLAALVGPSGAGKTTMTYLIPRLYDPSSGRILLDGHDLRDLKLSSLAQSIGMVTQETYLFHDTIRTNLLYARSDATQSEIERACRAANIHDFIMELSDGYDTIVGERGYRLSGGEKQRIAIARVILKDPRILVLDEATSHLDSQSEALIQEALERIMTNRTSIVIAHRLSTILKADVILVIDRGRIVERGTHAELMAGGGLYAALYETQFGGQPSAVSG